MMVVATPPVPPNELISINESETSEPQQQQQQRFNGDSSLPPLPPSRYQKQSSRTSTVSEDDQSVTSASSGLSSKSEERRRRRESWRLEHDAQLKVDGSFPRRNSDSTEDRKAVSERVAQHLGTKSTASPHTLPPAVSDSTRLRSNLLRNLGISGKGGSTPGTPISSPVPGHHRRIQSQEDPLSSASKIIKNQPKSRPLLSNVRLTEELKYDSDEESSPPTLSYSRFFGSNKSNEKASKRNDKPKDQPCEKVTARRRRLNISDEVLVVPIPMRSEYSNRIKERMYSGRVELSENAQRNVVEFEAEGWDASTVLDDENQFYKCPLTGELIHPVHLAYFNKNEAGLSLDDR